METFDEDEIDSFDEDVFVDMDACFAAFDKNGDGKLDIDEFRLICKALFRNDRGKIYSLDEKKVAEIFEVFDQNSDGFIGKLVHCSFAPLKLLRHFIIESLGRAYC